MRPLGSKIKVVEFPAPDVNGCRELGALGSGAGPEGQSIGGKERGVPKGRGEQEPPGGGTDSMQLILKPNSCG